MLDIFIATLGQRPEAITIALDLLLERYPIGSVVIVHTNPTESGISKAYGDLRTVLEHDYPTLKQDWEEIRQADRTPLLDIVDEHTATAYFHGIYKILFAHRKQGALHLLVAGGRKIMSVYSAMAAALAFRSRDCLWTVHSPPELVKLTSQFHIPPLLRDKVHLVQLPMRPIRAAQDAPIEDLEAFVQQQRDTRSEFLSRLTPQERVIAQAVERQPDANSKRLGEIFHKSDRTVENQLAAIYGKMCAFLDRPVPSHRKRDVLLELLRGEL